MSNFVVMAFTYYTRTLCIAIRTSIFNVSMDTLCGMKYQGVVSVHGLTERQIKIIQDLSNIFRSQNTAGKNLTVEQYSILGQIVEEMTK